MKILSDDEVVRKWMYYVWNFSGEGFTIDGQKRMLPSVFAAWQNDRLLGHIADKYMTICDRRACGGSQGLLHLYFELDRNHQDKMINWIMKNYTGV